MKKSIFFRLASLAFLALLTPLLARLTHSPIGFFLIFSVAIIGGVIDYSTQSAAAAISRGIRRNRALVFFGAWYAIGSILNIIIRGQGFSEWRLMVGPVLFIVTVLCAFYFSSRPGYQRTLQALLLIFLGIQAILTVRELAGGAGVAREMWRQFEGAWEFGNQASYASWAMATPIFLWFALKERGPKRIAFLFLSSFICLAATLASFATPLMLLAIGGAVIGLLSMFFPLRKRKRAPRFVYVFILVLLGLVFYQFTKSLSFYATSYERISNFLENPRGGGYAGTEVEASRWKLAEFSIRSFLSAPLFGKGGGSIRNSPYVGGHSSLLDALGAYGLFGGGGAYAGFLLVTLVYSFRRFLRNRTWGKPGFFHLDHPPGHRQYY